MLYTHDDVPVNTRQMFRVYPLRECLHVKWPHSTQFLVTMQVAFPRTTGISSGLKAHLLWGLIPGHCCEIFQNLGCWLFSKCAPPPKKKKKKKKWHIVEYGGQYYTFRPSNWKIGRLLTCGPGDGNSPNLNCDRSLHCMSSSHVIGWCTVTPAPSTACKWCGSIMNSAGLTFGRDSCAYHCGM